LRAKCGGSWTEIGTVSHEAPFVCTLSFRKLISYKTKMGNHGRISILKRAKG
jgi:hypothetical protein